jgi:hypothetical protein
MEAAEQLDERVETLERAAAAASDAADAASEEVAARLEALEERIDGAEAAAADAAEALRAAGAEAEDRLRQEAATLVEVRGAGGPHHGQAGAPALSACVAVAPCTSMHIDPSV